MATAVAVALFATIVLHLIATPPMAAASANPSTRVATAVGTEFPITIDNVAPFVSRPDSQLFVDATVYNPSDEDFEGTVTLAVSRIILTTHDQVSAWQDSGPLEAAGTPLATEDVKISANGVVNVSFDVPANDMALLRTSDGLGPRGIAVHVDGSTEAASGRLGIARSFVIWQPLTAAETPSIDLAVAVPLTGEYRSLANDLDTDGRLTRIVSATTTNSVASWLVDPALVLAAARGLPPTLLESPFPAVLDAGPTWAATVQGEMNTRDIVALPLFDGDMALLSQPGGAPDPSPALRGALDDVTRSWTSAIALPDEAAPSVATIEEAAALGRNTVIALEGYGVTGNPVHDVGGVTLVTHQLGDSKVLVADPALTDLFVHPPGSTPAEATQAMLADVVVTARQDTDHARTFLIAPPRGWDPDVPTVQSLLTALASADFINPVSITHMSQSEVEQVERELPTPADADGSASRLNPADWIDLVTEARDASKFAEIAADPSALAAPISDSVLLASSLTWRHDPVGRDAVTTAATDSAKSLRSSQSVVIGSNVNLISTSGLLPVTVANALEQDVTVTVRLVPDHARLVAEPVTDVKVPATSEVAVEVPVRAVGSGDVDVAVRLQSTSGDTIATPASFRVRVRADWESRGTIAIGGVLALALIAGIWRTIRRGRAATRTTQGPTAAPAPTSRTTQENATP